MGYRPGTWSWGDSRDRRGDDADHRGLSYLKRNDYSVTLVEIPDTDHGEHVFHDINNDWAELPTDSEGGQQTVRSILEAINHANT